MHSKSVLKLAPLAFALAAIVGCSGGSSSSGGAPAAQQPATTSLNGTSSKGIVKGGLVNAYAINTDGTKGAKVASQTETDTKGKYSLTLNDAYVAGSPILIEITAQDGTLMRCDLASCGTDKNGDTIVFGQDYALDSTFSLSAILPKASGESVSVNVTPITQMGASLAIKRIKAGAKAGDAAAVANAQVKSLLDIKGDITSLPVVDITDAESVNGANADDLDYNLKAAGIVQAMRKDNSGQSVIAALTSFVDQYVNDDGLADKEDADSAKLTLQEILESAVELVEEVKKVEGVQSDREDLTKSETELKAKETDKKNNGSTEVKQGEAPDDIGSEGLQATKAFVQQIRDLANTSTLSVNQQAFADQVDMAAAAVDGDTEVVAEGLGRALAAIAEAWDAHNNPPESESGSAESPASTPEGELSVDVTPNENGTVTYTIQQTTLNIDTTDDGVDNGTDVTVSMTATDGTSFSETEEPGETEGSSESSGQATLNLVVTGSSASELLSIRIAEGSLLQGSGSYNETRTGTDGENSFSETRNESLQASLNAALNVVLSQLQPVEEGQPTVEFAGGFSFSLQGFTSNGTYTESGEHPPRDPSTGAYTYSYQYDDEYTDAFTTAGVTLSGKFSNSDGEQLLATVGVSASNFSQTCTEQYENSGSATGYYDTNPQWTYIDESDCETSESEGDFVGASLSLIFDVDLAGLDDDVNVTVNATRTGLESGTLDTTLTYAGKFLRLDYTGGDDVTISNHNNVIMTLTETEIEGEHLVSGDIKQAGEQFATVSEESSAVIVRYSDGTFESAM